MAQGSGWKHQLCYHDSSSARGDTRVKNAAETDPAETLPRDGFCNKPMHTSESLWADDLCFVLSPCVCVSAFCSMIDS